MKVDLGTTCLSLTQKGSYEIPKFQQGVVLIHQNLFRIYSDFHLLVRGVERFRSFSNSHDLGPATIRFGPWMAYIGSHWTPPKMPSWQMKPFHPGGDEVTGILGAGVD